MTRCYKTKPRSDAEIDQTWYTRRDIAGFQKETRALATTWMQSRESSWAGQLYTLYYAFSQLDEHKQTWMPHPQCITLRPATCGFEVFVVAAQRQPDVVARLLAMQTKVGPEAWAVLVRRHTQGCRLYAQFVAQSLAYSTAHNNHEA